MISGYFIVLILMVINILSLSVNLEIDCQVGIYCNIKDEER